MAWKRRLLFIMTIFIHFWYLCSISGVSETLQQKSVHLVQDVTHSNNPFRSCQPSQRQPTESMIILGIPERLRLPHHRGPVTWVTWVTTFRQDSQVAEKSPGMVGTSEKQIEPEYGLSTISWFQGYRAPRGKKWWLHHQQAPRRPNSSHSPKKSQALGTEAVPRNLKVVTIFRDS